MRVAYCRFGSSMSTSGIDGIQGSIDDDIDTMIKVEIRLENDYGDVMTFERFIEMKNWTQDIWKW